MNKSFTEISAPPKERVILTLRFTKVLDTNQCERCHMSRCTTADKRPYPPPMCAVCGRLFCWACYGHEGAYTGSDFKHYPICNDCGELNREEIDAILELRAKLSQP